MAKKSAPPPRALTPPGPAPQPAPQPSPNKAAALPPHLDEDRDRVIALIAASLSGLSDNVLRHIEGVIKAPAKIASDASSER
jgi:hypothetical protein